MARKSKHRSLEIIFGRDDVQVQLNVKVSENSMNQLKWLSAHTNTPLRDIVIDAIRRYMEIMLPRNGAVPEKY